MDSIYYSNDFSYLFNKDDVVLVYTVSGHSILTKAVMKGAIEKKANVYTVTTNENIEVPLKALSYCLMLVLITLFYSATIPCSTFLTIFYVIILMFC